MLLFVLGMFLGSFLGVTALAIAKASQDAPDVISLTDREQISGKGPMQGDKAPTFALTPALATI